VQNQTEPHLDSIQKNVESSLLKNPIPPKNGTKYTRAGDLPGERALVRLKLSLQRGDLATFAASCIVTSANDSLVGTLQPTYWRFIARHSVDGSLREAAGPELDEACLQIEPVQAPHCRGIRRDITRWTGGVKHGASAPVRCDS
jgi:hypothetical protein